MKTTTVYILPDNGGTPVEREVIFAEDLEDIIRPMIIELTVCREAFRFDARNFLTENRKSRAETCIERAEMVNKVLKEAPGPIMGLLPEVKL